MLHTNHVAENIKSLLICAICCERQEGVGLFGIDWLCMFTDDGRDLMGSLDSRDGYFSLLVVLDSCSPSVMGSLSFGSWCLSLLRVPAAFRFPFLSPPLIWWDCGVLTTVRIVVC